MEDLETRKLFLHLLWGALIRMVSMSHCSVLKFRYHYLELFWLLINSQCYFTFDLFHSFPQSLDEFNVNSFMSAPAKNYAQRLLKF